MALLSLVDDDGKLNESASNITNSVVKHTFPVRSAVVDDDDVLNKNALNATKNVVRHDLGSCAWLG